MIIFVSYIVYPTGIMCIEETITNNYLCINTFSV